MSSKITSIHASIVSALNTAFSTSHIRLAEPYELNLNPAGYLEKGYGLKWNSSGHAIEEFCSRTDKHVFSVVFTSVVEGDDSEPTKYDAPTVTLLESIATLRKALEKTSNLSDTGIETIEISEANGINKTVTDKVSFISVEQQFTVILKETI